MFITVKTDQYSYNFQYTENWPSAFLIFARLNTDQKYFNITRLKTDEWNYTVYQSENWSLSTILIFTSLRTDH